MGRIFAVYELMPESTDVDLDGVIGVLKTSLPEGVDLRETKIEPVAFGLMKVVIHIEIDDSIDGIGGNLENALVSIDGIENAECTSSTVL
jgi:translation elongation factor aEF-1 beta